MRDRTWKPVCLAVCLSICASAFASDEKAPARGLDLEWNLRMRQESVADDAFLRDASALTLRGRFGVRATLGAGWQALIEGEGVAAAVDRYNSGANGKSAFPQVIDPSGLELNQAWLGWKAAKGALTLGRQRLQFDNQRWVGNSGWRQNEQTFDGIAAEWRPSSSVLLRYAGLARVHRVNSDEAIDPLARERSLASHVVDLAYTRGENQWGAYWIGHQDRDVRLASTATIGLRWTLIHPTSFGAWGWRVESARQSDYGGNSVSFDHGYWLLEPWLKWRGVTWKAGQERLGGNGTHSLQTPLATLHAFNGWADKFLVTPPTGLVDSYFGVGGALGARNWPAKAAWAVAWHDYRTDAGRARFGSEIDASVSYPFSPSLLGMVKLADYRANAWSRDTKKLWLQLEWTPNPRK